MAYVSDELGRDRHDNPIFVGIGSLFFFKEKMHRNLIFGILLAGVGGLAINFAGVADGNSTDTSYGNWLALCGAWTASGYLLVGVGCGGSWTISRTYSPSMESQG